jgi:hypothetical protein
MNNELDVKELLLMYIESSSTPAYKFVPTFNRDKNSLLLSFRRKEKSLAYGVLKHMVERFLLTSK